MKYMYMYIYRERERERERERDRERERKSLPLVINFVWKEEYPLVRINRFISPGKGLCW